MWDHRLFRETSVRLLCGTLTDTRYRDCSVLTMQNGPIHCTLVQCEFTTKYAPLHSLIQTDTGPCSQALRSVSCSTCYTARLSQNVRVPTAWQYGTLIVRKRAKPVGCGTTWRSEPALPFNLEIKVDGYHYSLCDAPHTFTSAMVCSIQTATCEPTL